MEHAFHTPILLEQVLEYFITDRAGIYVDTTLGGGGHGERILDLLDSKGKLVGIEADEDALRFAADRLQRFGSRAILIRANFSNLKSVLAERRIATISGLLLDLGISSYQIDYAGKGFSFRTDERLDMRMDKHQNLDAWTVVNQYSEKELADILWKYGEEKISRRIAKRINEFRREKSLNTTGELAGIVQSVVKSSFLNKSLARVFQAIRIEVNNELENLRKVLQDALDILNVGGRIVTISYHSLEDRIVKEFFKEEASALLHSRSKLLPDKTKVPRLKILTRKPIKPSSEEIQRNPRARSAKMRVAEKITD